MSQLLKSFIKRAPRLEESAAFKRHKVFFNILLLVVIFWLPIQWYLENKSKLSADFIVLANWIVWAIFFLEIVIMTTLSSQKRDYFFKKLAQSIYYYCDISSFLGKP